MNGSYLVFRRLRQDVFGFHSFLRQQAGLLNVTPEALAAKLVGRWASGAPTMREPKLDNPLLANDDCANNHFQFDVPTQPTRKNRAEDQCTDTTYPQSTGDPSGDRCPLSSHIRKAYPRDDLTGVADRETHRLLRRGIPFGPSSRSTPSAPAPDDLDRGLLFVAYMTSITDQFEFVIKNWVNNPDFKEPGVGVDPLLGQSQGAGGGRRRTFSVRVRGRDNQLKAPEDWVIPTGGGYFFSPSICALKNVLGAARPKPAVGADGSGS